MSKKTLILLLILLAVFVVFPFTGVNQYYIQFVINMLMYAYFATSWNILGGYAGQMAMGNGVYVGIGAYITVVLYLYEGLTPWIGMLIGGLISAAIAYVFGRITFRLGGTYFALSTICLLHITRLLLYSNSVVFGYNTGGAVGLYIDWTGENFWGMQFTSKTPFYFILLVMLILGAFVSWKVKTSRLGYYLSAIKTDQTAASSLGVDVMACKLKAGCLSAFMLAVGGAVFVFILAVVDPTRVLGIALSQQILLYCVVGGLGTIAGPICAAFLLSPLNDILRATLGAQYSGLALVVYGLALMLIILFLPNGIWDPMKNFFASLYDKLTNRKTAAQ